MALTNEDLKAIADLIQPINDRLDKMDDRLDNLEVQIKRTERNLKHEIIESENLILDEVERVHHILDKHKEDKTVHTA